MLFGIEDEPFARIFHTPQFVTPTAIDFDRWRRQGGRLAYRYAWYTPWRYVVGFTLRDQTLKLKHGPGRDDWTYTPAHQIFGWGEDTPIVLNYDLAQDFVSPQLETPPSLMREDSESCVRIPREMACQLGDFYWEEDVFLDVAWAYYASELSFSMRALLFSPRELALLRLWKKLPKRPPRRDIIYHEEA